MVHPTQGSHIGEHGGSCQEAWDLVKAIDKYKAFCKGSTEYKRSEKCSVCCGQSEPINLNKNDQSE